MKKETKFKLYLLARKPRKFHKTSALLKLAYFSLSVAFISTKNEKNGNTNKQRLNNYLNLKLLLISQKNYNCFIIKSSIGLTDEYIKS